MSDSYRSIRAGASARLTRERSRFVGLVFPAHDVASIEEILRSVRREHHDASHCPFAYRLLLGLETVERVDDDGEPRGTAGAPILRELRSAEVLNLVAVVVRHFGGVKLGRGGLARAYAEATRAALEGAAIAEIHRQVRVTVCFPAALGARVMATVHRHRARVVEVDYTHGGRLVALVSPSRSARFAADVEEATGGRARCEEAV